MYPPVPAYQSAQTREMLQYHTRKSLKKTPERIIDRVFHVSISYIILGVIFLLHDN